MSNKFFNTIKINSGDLNIVSGSVSTGTLSATTITGGNVNITSLTAGNLAVPGSLTVTNVTVQNLIQTIGSLTVTNITASNIVASGTISSGTGFMFKNRIMNGAFTIDQRMTNTTAANAGNGLNVYGPDRFGVTCAGLLGGIIFQQANLPATLPGFSKCIKIVGSFTVTDTVSGHAILQQFIEGSNVADLAWGTANAQPVTASFWVYSNATGTYAFSVNNNSYNMSYVSNFTINAANTWQKVTVTVPGPTSGTWANDTSNFGILFRVTFASGSNYLGTQNTWISGGVKIAGTGISTLGNNTLYLTGIQLEQGSIATPFEHRPINVELSLCQRYFEVLSKVSISFNSNTFFGNNGNLFPTWGLPSWSFKQSKIKVPTMTISCTGNGFDFVSQTPNTDTLASTNYANFILRADTEGAYLGGVQFDSAIGGNPYIYGLGGTANAEF